MRTAIWIVHMLTALAVIGLVLIQHGKGADVGAAFGGGSAGSLFGATGAANFLSRATAILAAVFFVASLGLTYYSSRPQDGGVMQGHTTNPAAATEKKEPAATPAPPTGSSKANEIPK